MIEKFNFVDKSFDSKNIADYHLSLQVFLKGFSFCILDRQRNKFIALSHYYYDKIVSYKVLLKEISQVVENETVLQFSYQHAKLMFATPKSTLLPSTFYEKELIPEIFNFNHDLQTYEQIDTNYIYGNSCYVIYAQPSALKSYFQSKFPSIKTYHQSCPLIEEVLLKNKVQSGTKSLYLNVFPSFFDVLWLNNGQLELFNSFAYKTVNDFQYFVLNVFEQLKISPREIPLYVSGLIKKDDLRIENLKKYIDSIEFLNKPNHFEFSYGFNDFPDHYFTNMINLYQCG